MRILIVEVNWLGDVLVSTPAIKALRGKFPDSFIACLIVPRVKEVLKGNPNIDRLIVYDEAGLHKGLFGKIGLVRELRENNFDLAVLFHRSFTRAMIVYAAGIPERLGYSTLKRKYLLTKPLPMPDKDSSHRVDYYLDLVKPLGCGTQDRFYEFFTSADDEEYIESFLEREGIVPGDFVVCLNAGGNWFPKRWPKENFALLADRLINEYKAKVIFSGSEQDVELVEEILRQMTYKPVIAAGYTSLKQSACLFRKADLLISSDSGPLHIAAGVGANIIGLFGPTSHLVTAPIGKGRISSIHKDIVCTVPCYDKKCVENKCMWEISVEDVLAEVGNFLGYKMGVPIP